MISLILGVLVGIGVLNGWMFLQQPGMVFFPDRQLVATPADWGFEYEDVFLQTPDGVRLHGWYLPRPGTERTLLFFHGNAGNISHRGESIAIFHRLGLNVFIPDYRGYGQSQGYPDERGVYTDARTAWSYLTEKRGIEENNITVFGRSLGASIAAELASEVNPGSVILESAFSSARDFSNSVFPVLSRLVVMRYGFDTADYVQRISCPVMVLHSPEDEIVPFSLGQKVYQAAREPKTFVELQGDHNSGFLRSQPAYERELRRFIEHSTEF